METATKNDIQDQGLIHFTKPSTGEWVYAFVEDGMDYAPFGVLTVIKYIVERRDRTDLWTPLGVRDFAFGNIHGEIKKRKPKAKFNVPPGDMPHESSDGEIIRSVSEEEPGLLALAEWEAIATRYIVIDFDMERVTIEPHPALKYSHSFIHYAEFGSLGLMDYLHGKEWFIGEAKRQVFSKLRPAT